MWDVTENDSDPDHDQFLLNADDLYSDDAWSSYSDTDTQGNNTVNDNDFEINSISWYNVTAWYRLCLIIRGVDSYL